MTVMCLLERLIDIPTKVVFTGISSGGNVSLYGVKDAPEVVWRLDLVCILEQEVSISVILDGSMVNLSPGVSFSTHVLGGILEIGNSGLPIEIRPHRLQ